MAPRIRRSVLFLVLGLLLLIVCSVAVRAAEDLDDDSGLEDDGFDAGPPSEEAPPAPAAPKKDKKIVNFAPSSLTAPFLEQFDSSWASRWIVSEAKKVVDGITDEDLLRYRGAWAVEEPSVLKGFEGDVGLVAKTAAAHHAISVKLPKAIDNTGKTLVAQYEVKLQDGLECGGAYIKLLKDTPEFDANKFEDKFPYVIMFGPDKCGTTNKVHFIFKHKNPKTGEYEEKHLKNPPSARTDKMSTLYTLIVRPDNTYEILINNESASKGNLLEDFEPAVNPAKEIDDPNDKKPSDWVDEAKIADPEAKKPDDWNEDAPEYIPDEDAKKPEDWNDNEPEQIADPDATKPEDWDDEEDGEWVAPTIPNPKCEGGNCGEWKRPTKKNPEYKGKWRAPMIDNPAYKGVWAPRKIDNPNYFEDKTPSNLEPIGAIGVEIWTMQKDILFDNFYLGHSEEDAKKFAEETWKVKNELEKEEEEVSKPPEPVAKSTDGSSSDDEGFIGNLRKEIGVFTAALKEDPVKAVQKHPLHLVAFTIVALLLISAVNSILGGSAPAPAPKAAEKAEKVVKAEEKEEKTDEAAPKKRAAKKVDDE